MSWAALSFLALIALVLGLHLIRRLSGRGGLSLSLLLLALWMLFAVGGRNALGIAAAALLAVAAIRRYAA